MPNTAHVLVIETEKSSANGLVTQLREANFEVTVAAEADAVIEIARDIRPDAIFLDIAMTRKTELLTHFRAQGAAPVPVLLLVNKGEEAEATAAMSLGADDFIVKPLRPFEPVARLQMALRRAAEAPPPRAVALRAGPIFMNVDRHETFMRGANGEEKQLHLTRREFDLLRALMTRKNQMMSRAQIVEEAFGHNARVAPANLGAYIHRLRDKVEPEPAFPRHIVTDRGLGFKIID
jgi:two-component system response regulator RegX3